MTTGRRSSSMGAGVIWPQAARPLPVTKVIARTFVRRRRPTSWRVILSIIGLLLDLAARSKFLDILADNGRSGRCNFTVIADIRAAPKVGS